MIIGACQLTFHLPGNRTLKGKRQTVKRLCERIRSRFHVSVAEVDSVESHQRACLGIALVGSEVHILQSVLDRIVRAIEQWHIAPIVDQQVEMIQYDQSFGIEPRSMAERDAFYENKWGDEEEEWTSDTEDEIEDAPWATESEQSDNAWEFLDEWDGKNR